MVPGGKRWYYLDFSLTLVILNKMSEQLSAGLAHKYISMLTQLNKIVTVENVSPAQHEHVSFPDSRQADFRI